MPCVGTKFRRQPLDKIADGPRTTFDRSRTPGAQTRWVSQHDASQRRDVEHQEQPPGTPAEHQRSVTVALPNDLGATWPVASLKDVDRITVNPQQMGGVPCIRGLRIPVATVVGMIANGINADEVVAELPPLELEDVAAALWFAADAVADRQIPLQPTA
jgi:uncharacterized protein (DUF433 family)